MWQTLFPAILNMSLTEKGVSAWNRGNDPAHSFYLLVGNIPEDLLLQIQKMISSPAAISSRRCPLC